MRNNLAIMWRQRALLVILLFQFHQICATNKQMHVCSPSSCGKITNITNPFRLKGDPEDCGDKRYELVCENNVTLLYLDSQKYNVQAINYNNFTIRVVDSQIQQSNCSSLPPYFFSRSNFTDTYDYGATLDPYQDTQKGDSAYNDDGLVFEHIVIMNCVNPVSDNDKYVNTAPCVNWDYTYAIVGDLKAKDLEVGCDVKMVVPTSLWGLDSNKYSYTQLHTALVYGFEISWMSFPCDNLCGKNRYCYFDTSTKEPRCLFTCSFWFESGNKCGIWHLLKLYVEEICGRPIFSTSGIWDLLAVTFIVLILWTWKLLFGVPLIIALVIYKWRKRHLSMYESIENYLEQNNLMPIRYSYKEIKKMGGGFKEKLGEGGYGSVFKGKLRSGPCVAIKMLGKSKGKGQDFISEVATIGRIHHNNVVQLIGFCVEGSKRSLVYEFMPNGSLDKFIFSKDESIHLSYDKIYNISIGVARGISYLHHGCEMKILHFDIKPHNILLDENFIPKISDFGLAKLYPIDNSIVTMTEARGTIGYMAPELFYKNIGGISHKADVYSFGMLLMEMTSKRRNLNPHVERSSQLYFPFWIYNHLEDEKDIEMEGVTEEEKKIAKKMIIIALWCIQLKPNDRPSMNKVLEMLEGDIESLEIPPKPTLYPHEIVVKDQRVNSNKTISSDFISFDLSV